MDVFDVQHSVRWFIPLQFGIVKIMLEDAVNHALHDQRYLEYTWHGADSIWVTVSAHQVDVLE